MAETLAQIGYLTLLKLGNTASPVVYTSVLEVRSINGFGFTASELEVTHMESPNGYIERIAGMKDGDTITVVCNMVRQNSIDLKGVWDAGLVRRWELNFPGTLPDYDFSAIPLGWHVTGVEPNSALQLEVTMRITAAIGGS